MKEKKAERKTGIEKEKKGRGGGGRERKRKMQALSRSEKSAKSVGIYSTNASAQRELSPLSSSFTFYSLVHGV